MLFHGGCGGWGWIKPEKGGVCNKPHGKIILMSNNPNPGSIHFLSPLCSVLRLRFLFASTELFTQLAFTSQVSSSFLFSSAKVSVEIQAAPAIGYEILLHPVVCVWGGAVYSSAQFNTICLGVASQSWKSLSLPDEHSNPPASLDPQVTPGT